jgi:phosphoadenosine phosphosulfate reductase
MLIQSHRHTPKDLERWAIWEASFRVHSERRLFAEHVARAEAALLKFVAAGPCYCGVSWGKDSAAVADMVARIAPRIPIVWVRVTEDYNPDCPLVRDAFLRIHTRCRYEEIEVPFAATVGRGTAYLRDAVAQRHGNRYISGVRSEESRDRLRRSMRWGESSASTCAPLAWWSGDDVFAYLLTRYLPIHPAYACLLDGHLDPRRIRVSALGGPRGTRSGDGHGRAEWEERYYPQEVSRLDAR